MLSNKFLYADESRPRVGEYEISELAGYLLLYLVFCTGPIPKELGALSKLKELWLGQNRLTGEEPKKGRSGFKVNPAHAWVGHDRRRSANVHVPGTFFFLF